jgi:hypothetical protein
MSDLVKWPRPNGLSYDFRIVPMGARLPAGGGIYIFCRQTVPGNWSALYVGKSSDLDNRAGSGVRTHHAYGPSIRAGATHVCYMQMGGLLFASLDLVERELCAHLKPPINQQLVRAR